MGNAENVTVKGCTGESRKDIVLCPLETSIKAALDGPSVHGGFLETCGTGSTESFETASSVFKVRGYFALST